VIRKLLLVSLLAVLALLAIGDLAAKHAAEHAIASEAQSHMAGVGTVKATISSFPFVGRLLVQAKVSKLDLLLSDVTGHGIDVARLDVVGRAIELDRSALAGSQHVKIKGLDSVTVTATISEATVRALTRADVRLLAGKATVTVAGRTVDAAARVEGGSVRLVVASTPVASLPMPDSSLLPCQVALTITPGALELACTATRLPTLVVDAVGSVSLRH